MYACKIVASTHVDVLQAIWRLERIAFDGVMLGKFVRHIIMQQSRRLGHKYRGPHIIRRECIQHQHHMVNVQKSLKDTTENYVIAYLPTQIC